METQKLTSYSIFICIHPISPFCHSFEAILKYMFYGTETTIDILSFFSFSASIYVIEIQMQPKDGRTKACFRIEDIFYLISCLVNQRCRMPKIQIQVINFHINYIYYTVCTQWLLPFILILYIYTKSKIDNLHVIHIMHIFHE